MRKHSGLVIFRIVVMAIAIALLWIGFGENVARWVMMALIMVEIFFISAKQDEQDK